MKRAKIAPAGHIAAYGLFCGFLRGVDRVKIKRLIGAFAGFW